jgi:hypothetical protein
MTLPFAHAYTDPRTLPGLASEVELGECVGDVVVDGAGFEREVGVPRGRVAPA